MRCGRRARERGTDGDEGGLRTPGIAVRLVRFGADPPSLPMDGRINGWDGGPGYGACAGGPPSGGECHPFSPHSLVSLSLSLSASICCGREI
jgi:hypothetical protein